MPAVKRGLPKDFGSTANHVWQSTKAMRKHVIERCDPRPASDRGGPQEAADALYSTVCFPRSALRMTVLPRRIKMDHLFSLAESKLALKHLCSLIIREVTLFAC